MSFVQLSGVSKVYRSLKGADYTAVRDFSLDIQPGEFFCLLGTSGCGKTTVLNMVAGFERASSGSITISGRPITGPAADRGVVFQSPSLLPWLTAFENVMLGEHQTNVVLLGEITDQPSVTLYACVINFDRLTPGAWTK